MHPVCHGRFAIWPHLEPFHVDLGQGIGHRTGPWDIGHSAAEGAHFSRPRGQDRPFRRRGSSRWVKIGHSAAEGLQSLCDGWPGRACGKDISGAVEDLLNDNPSHVALGKILGVRWQSIALFCEVSRGSPRAYPSSAVLRVKVQAPSCVVRRALTLDRIRHKFWPQEAGPREDRAMGHRTEDLP